VVEDEDEVRRLAVRILKKQGYEVLEASHGGEASIICEQQVGTIHLILTDVVLPVMSGRKLVETLLPLHPEMKVLYMSGYTDNAIAHHGVLEKGLSYIQKPFTVVALVRKVREVLDRDSNSC
jgi:DNA-binding response OmpR family regulator